ncbi:Dabb family protein [Aquirufa regiilacus]
MLHHSVFLKFKSETSLEEQAYFIAESRKLAQIPGVMNLQVLEEFNATNLYTHGLGMDFEDQAAYDVYSNHPLHNRFVQEVWLPRVEKWQEIDYRELRVKS